MTIALLRPTRIRTSQWVVHLLRMLTLNVDYPGFFFFLGSSTGCSNSSLSRSRCGFPQHKGWYNDVGSAWHEIDAVVYGRLSVFSFPWRRSNTVSAGLQTLASLLALLFIDLGLRYYLSADDTNGSSKSADLQRVSWSAGLVLDSFHLSFFRFYHTPMRGLFWWGFVYPSASTRPSFVSRSPSTALPCKVYITALCIVCFPALHALVGGVNVIAALFVALRVFFPRHFGQGIFGAHSTKPRAITQTDIIPIHPSKNIRLMNRHSVCCWYQFTLDSCPYFLHHYLSVLLDDRVFYISLHSGFISWHDGALGLRKELVRFELLLLVPRKCDTFAAPPSILGITDQRPS